MVAIWSRALAPARGRGAGLGLGLAFVLLPFADILPGLSAPPRQAQAEAPSAAEFEAGSVLVKFKPSVFAQAAEADLALRGLQTVTSIPNMGVRKVTVPQGKELEAVASLLGDPLVEHAEPNYLRRPHWVPNDPYYGPYQWKLRQINMEAAWDISRGSASVIVAVVDTGLEVGTPEQNPDCPANLVSPKDVCTGGLNANPTMGHGHGTHVAGIIAANTDNGAGVAGVAPRVSLMPIRADCAADGTFPVDKEAEAINYAVDNGATVINLSLGGAQSSQTEQDAINYALGKGVLVVAAAGNEYKEGNPVQYPAAYPGVLAVGASTFQDTRASYSEVQPYVAVVAPVGDATSPCQYAPNQWILSTYTYIPNQGSFYKCEQGTSMAAPHVSGLAALIFSVNPKLTAAQVTRIITSTAVDLGTPGKDDLFGWGRVDAYASLARAKAVPPPVPPRSGDWPVEGYSAAHPGYNPVESVLSPPLRLKWSYATGGRLGLPLVVANGLVYVASGGLANRLYALEEATGGLRWSYDGGQYRASFPTVANGLAYVLTDKLYA